MSLSRLSMETRMDSDNELHMANENWLRFMLLTSASEERPMNKLSPLVAQNGFQAIAGTLKGIGQRRFG